MTLFDDFERYARVPDEYQEPEAKPYQPTVRDRRDPTMTTVSLRRVLCIRGYRTHQSGAIRASASLLWVLCD